MGGFDHTAPTPACKTCLGCGVTKPLGEFHRHAQNGHQPRCKTCRAADRAARAEERNARARELYRANAEERRRKQREYNARNRGRRRELDRARYAKDREKRLACARASAELRRDRIRARNRAYAKANPERWARARLLRKARKAGLPADFRVADMRRGLGHWGGCCAVCGRPFGRTRHSRLNWDHWVPLVCPACPGTVPGNMIPLCGLCNNRKRSKDPEAFARELLGPAAEARLALIRAYLTEARAWRPLDG